MIYDLWNTYPHLIDKSDLDIAAIMLGKSLNKNNKMKSNVVYQVAAALDNKSRRLKLLLPDLSHN